MNIFFIFITVILLALIQVSILPFFAIWGIIINIFLLITLSLAINQWDELAPLFVGLGGICLDFLTTGQFGLYTIELVLVYFLIYWLSSKTSILIEKQYLVAIWVFVGILSFELINLIGLYLIGDIQNFLSYIVITLKFLVIHMFLYIPIDYIVRSFYKKKLTKPQINL